MEITNNLEDNGTKVLPQKQKQRQPGLCQEERRFLHEKSTLQSTTKADTTHIHESITVKYNGT